MSDTLGPIELPVAGGTQVLAVKAGQTWRFTANGDWHDGKQACGPQGYRNFVPFVLDIRPEIEDAPYGCVIGRFKGRSGAGFQIGLGAVRTFKEDGEIEFGANLRAKYADTAKGAVSFTAQRLDGPIPRPCGIAPAWSLFRRTVDRTAGLTFISILTLGVGAALAMLPQGQDLVRTISEPGSKMLAPKVWFAVAVFLLSMQAWFWSRVIVNFNYGSDRDTWRPRWFLEWAPRALGVAPGLFSLWAMSSSPKVELGVAAGIVGASFLTFLWVLGRQDAWDRIKAQRMERTGKPPARVGRLWVLTWLVLAVLAYVALWISPVGLARWLGPPAVVFIGVAMIIPPVVIAIQSGQPVRVPALTALLAVALLFSFGFDNHRVGRRAGMGTKETAGTYTRYDLDQAYALWRKQARVDPRDNSIPIVLVAAEGGASRAGHWTGAVLSKLHQDTEAKAADAIFAISSVSGGSVGAVGYAAAVQDYRDKPAELTRQVYRLTGDDALSPTVGGLLFADLLQRFIPLGFPDRAEALERSWEDSWKAGCGGRKDCLSDRMGRPFLEIWKDGAPLWTPLVIVNGASEETGRRVLTSKLALRADQVNAQDFYTTTDRNIPASTAIHNGARFPYISPAGTMVDRGRLAHGHIIDGGYFDPAGTEVVRELARAIVQGPGSADKDRLKFIFVFVGYGTSDIPAAGSAAPAGPTPASRATRRFANEVMAPLRGMLSSRGGHAQHMARNVKADVSMDGREQNAAVYAAGPNEGAALRGLYVPMLLCDDPEKQDSAKLFVMPMDWALSGEAKRRMDLATTRCGANGELLKILVDAVNGATAPLPPIAAAPVASATATATRR